MSDNDDPWITIDETATILDLDRTGVYRRAIRGDFGPIKTIGGTKRPSIILIDAAKVDAFKAGYRPRRPRYLSALALERALCDDLATELDIVLTSGRHTCTNHLDLGRIDDLLARYREARQQ